MAICHEASQSIAQVYRQREIILRSTSLSDTRMRRYYALCSPIVDGITFFPLAGGEVFGTRVGTKSSARSVEIFASSRVARSGELSRGETLVGEGLVRSSVARSGELSRSDFVTGDVCNPGRVGTGTE